MRSANKKFFTLSKKKLKDITEIHSGYLFKSKIEHIKDGDISLVQLRDVNDQGMIDWENTSRIHLEKNNPKSSLKEGDVLFKAKSRYHTSALVSNIGGRALATAHFFILRVPRKSLLPGYLAWYLNQKPAQTYFKKVARGTRVLQVNKKLLGELEIIVPDKNTQQRIVKIDELFKKQKELENEIMNLREKWIKGSLIKAINES